MWAFENANVEMSKLTPIPISHEVRGGMNLHRWWISKSRISMSG